MCIVIPGNLPRPTPTRLIRHQFVIQVIRLRILACRKHMHHPTTTIHLHILHIHITTTAILRVRISVLVLLMRMHITTFIITHRITKTMKDKWHPFNTAIPIPIIFHQEEHFPQ